MTGAPPELITVFHLLEAHFGPQQWWPAESPFEVVVGAILTQNTAWANVEKAMAGLRAAGALTPRALCGLSPEALERLIRPAGFFRQKGGRLRHVTTVLVQQHDGDVERLCAGPLDEARRRLLALPGIGPETADSILLYAAHRASFVVDAYTRRIFSRLGLLTGAEGYAVIRDRFMAALPPDARLFNEFHALIVTLAKSHCRKRHPACPACPLLRVCRFARQDAESG